jgi:hypothetical protein
LYYAELLSAVGDQSNLSRKNAIIDSVGVRRLLGAFEAGAAVTGTGILEGAQINTPLMSF